MVRAFHNDIYTVCDQLSFFSPSLVLGHVLLSVRFLPRRSFSLIANYTSELVCWLWLSAIFEKHYISVSGNYITCTCTSLEMGKNA